MASDELARTNVDETAVSIPVLKQWLAQVGSLCASGRMTETEAMRRISAYSAMLQSRPAWQFSLESIEAVARACRFFPSYAELVEALDLWTERRAIRIDRLRALTSPPSPPPQQQLDGTTPQERKTAATFFAWIRSNEGQEKIEGVR
ncbi:hypothetical protein CCP2SC5_1830001 [Azospirillaceae bacterium]